MMDHKTIENRDARADIQIRIAGITEEQKKELFERYYDPEVCLKSQNIQKALIGNWLINAARMLLKGATDEEIDQVVKHLVVLIHAVKFKLNVKRSFDDHGLGGLAEKYLAGYKTVNMHDGDVCLKEGSTAYERAKNRDEIIRKRKELVEKAQKK